MTAGLVVVDSGRPFSHVPELPQRETARDTQRYMPAQRETQAFIPALPMFSAAAQSVPAANLGGREWKAPPRVPLDHSAAPQVTERDRETERQFAAARSAIMADAAQQYWAALGDKQSQEKGIDTRPKRDSRWADIGSGADAIRFSARDLEVFAKEHGLAPYESLFESPEPDLNPDVPLAACQSACNVFTLRQVEIDGIRPPLRAGVRSAPSLPSKPSAAQKQPEERGREDFHVFDPRSASIPELVEKAEQTADPELQYMIGERHAKDLPPNLTEAAKWFRKAASNNHRKAQVAVAKMHAEQNRTSSMAGTKQDSAVQYLTTQCGWSHLDAVTEITGRPPAPALPSRGAATGFGNGSLPQRQQTSDQAGGAAHWEISRYGQQDQQLPHGSYGQRQPSTGREDFRQPQYASGRESYARPSPADMSGPPRLQPEARGGWDNRYGASSLSSSQQQPTGPPSTDMSGPPGIHAARSAGWAGRSADTSTTSAPRAQSSSSALSAPATGPSGATASSSLTQESPRVGGLLDVKIPRKIPKIPKKKTTASATGSGWYEQVKAAQPSSSSSSVSASSSLKREREGTTEQGEPKKSRAAPPGVSKRPSSNSGGNGTPPEKRRQKESPAAAAPRAVDEKMETDSVETASKTKPPTQQKEARSMPTSANPPGKQQRNPAQKKKTQAVATGSAALFPVGRLTWAKVGHYPYWPAKVISIDEVADEKSRKQLLAAQKNKKKQIVGAVLVMFYQSKDVSWIRPDRIANFEGADSAPDGSTKRSPEFEQAVAEALEQMANPAARSASSDTDSDGSDDGDLDSGASSESDIGDSDSEGPAALQAAGGARSNASVNALKVKYKKLKGTAARGSQANNAAWLQARIDELERGSAQKSQPAAVKQAKKTQREPSDVAASVASLKQRYTQLKGAAPRGPRANDAAWLQEKVEELEAAHTKNDAVNDSGDESDYGTSSP